MKSHLLVQLLGCLLFAGLVFAVQGITDTRAETRPERSTLEGAESTVMFAPERVRVWWLSFVSASWGGYPNGACVGSKGRHRTDAYDLTAGIDCTSGEVPQLVSMRTVALCNPCTSLSRHAVLAVFVQFGEYAPPDNSNYAELNTVDYSNFQHGTYRALHTTGSNGLSTNIMAGNPAQATTWAFAYTYDDENVSGFEGMHPHQDGKNGNLPGSGEGVYQPCWPAFYLIYNVNNYVNDWAHYWVYDRGTNGLLNEDQQPNC